MYVLYIHGVYTGTEWRVLTIQEYELNLVLIIRVGLCTWGIHSDRMRSTYYPGVCTKPGTYYQGGLCTWGTHRDRMRSTYYPGVWTKSGTYYQGWFMYMRYTQGQNEGSTYYPGVCTKPGTYYQGGLCTWGIHSDRMRSTYYPGVCTYVCTYVPNQALSKQVPLYMYTTCAHSNILHKPGKSWSRRPETIGT